MVTLLVHQIDASSLSVCHAYLFKHMHVYLLKQIMRSLSVYHPSLLDTITSTQYMFITGVPDSETVARVEAWACLLRDAAQGMQVNFLSLKSE